MTHLPGNRKGARRDKKKLNDNAGGSRNICSTFPYQPFLSFSLARKY